MTNLVSKFKTQFLGIIPRIEDKTGVLTPQQIVSLSAILTFEGESIEDILNKLREDGQNLDERVKLILQESSLRGHASVATTPVLCLSFEGSKFLDSALTGIVFSSSLMASGRRTEITKQDIIYPDKIFAENITRNLYTQVSERNIETSNYFLSKGVRKDEASKILHYGIYGTGIIQLPIESIVALRKEYELEREWMPEEVGTLLKEIEKETKNFGIDWLYATRQVAPGSFYPYPNIFKDPIKSNIVRDLKNKGKRSENSELISINTLITPELKKKLENFSEEIQTTTSSLNQIRENWPNLLDLRQEILRDYNLALKFKFLSSVAWRVWGEKKRHRTCPMVVESIYYSIKRASIEFKKFKKEIEGKKINEKLIEEIKKVFYIPPSIENNSEFLAKYLLAALKSFEAYEDLIKFGIKPKEAIFLIPRAIKIDVLQEYDLYNLLAGYYPLRLCNTAEEEMRRNTKDEVEILKNALEQRELGWLNKFIMPKCMFVGFCPEKKSCGMIKNLVKNYNEEFHQEIREELKKEFLEKLNKFEI